MSRARFVPLSAAMLAMTFGTVPIWAGDWNAGDGNWSVGSNWAPVGVPAFTEPVNIVTIGNPRTVTYDVSLANPGLLTIDHNGPGTTTLLMPGNNTLHAHGIFVGGFSGITGLPTNGRGALNQSAGSIINFLDLAVGFGASSTGTYTLSGGTLISDGKQFVGYSGTGIFNHSGGTNTIRPSGFLDVGVYAGSTGTYNLGGNGALVSNGSEYIGDIGAGVFNQTGGANTISGPGHLYLGYNASGMGGTYSLSAGDLKVSDGNEFIGYRASGVFNQTGGTNIINSPSAILEVGVFFSSTGTYNLGGNGALVSNGSEYIGDFGAGVFNQTGGTNTISGAGHNLYLGYRASGSGGTYTLSAGDLQVSDADEYIGYNGSGVFTQTGGTNSIRPSGFLDVGVYAGSMGTYNLGGSGALVVNGSEYIGDIGAGVFNQTGGANTISGPGHLYLGYNASGTGGTYSLSAGDLKVSDGNEFVGYRASGVFTQTGGTNIINSPSAILEVGVFFSSTGTYNLGGNGALVSNGSEYIGDFGAGVFNQTGGTNTISGAGHNLYLGYRASGSGGTYTLSAGDLQVSDADEYIGYNGSGVFTQTGGTNIINSPSAILDVGVYAGSTGTYNLGGSGALVVNGSEYIGDIGAGVFNQTGGANTISGPGHLYLGYNASGTGGTYSLSAGDLKVSDGNEFIGYRASGVFTQTGGTNIINSPSAILEVGVFFSSTGTYNLGGNGALVSNGSEYIGDFGAGVFNQTGGTNTISGAGHNLYLGYRASGSGGTYTLSAGDLQVSDADEYIGYNGSGVFTQTGGTNIINSPSAILEVGVFFGSTGTYNLGGNGAVSSQSLIVGNSGAGTFNQTGGTNNVSQLITLGFSTGSTGTYTLSGGSASANGIDVGRAGTGILTVSGTGVLTVNYLTVYNNAGTSVNLSGGTINAAALNLNGVPTLFNWTSGKLNLTTSVMWDSASAPFLTSAAFGASLVLGSNQTLMVTGDETLGGVGPFALTLNSGSTHLVTGTLTVGPTGSITLNPGSTLSYTGGLTNNGAMAFSGGNSDIHGDVTNNAGSKVIVTGGGTATFYGTVESKAGSEFRVSANSAAVFLGDVHGTSNFTGSGTKYFEAGVSSLGAVATAGSTVVQQPAVVSASHFREAALTVDGVANITPNGTSAGTSRLDSLTMGAGGKFDLNDNDLIVQSAAVNRQAVITTLTQQIASARNTSPGKWRGNGITSSIAAADVKNITGLAILLNDNGRGGALYALFDGQPVDANSILIKYTYDGDMDLNGKVDGADYFRIDNGFLSGLRGYGNGDLDYNGKLDGADYFLIDNAFLSQGVVLSGELGAAAVPEPDSVALLVGLACALAPRLHRRSR